MKRANKFEVKTGWKILLSDMGLDPAEVLTLARLPADLFNRENVNLFADEYFRIFYALEDLLGADQLPLAVGQSISTEAFDPAIFACMCSPNLNIAMKRLSQYKSLICPMIIEVHVESKQTTISVSVDGFVGDLPRSFALMEMVFFTQLARMSTRQEIQPLKVFVPTLPSELESYTRYFGVQVIKSKQTKIVFSAEDAARPFLTENAHMWDFFEEDFKKRLSQMDADSSLADKVKSVLLEILPSGMSSIDEVASRLAMSKRSVQRGLSNEGTSFQNVLSGTREGLAEHYLKQSDLSQGEISFLLGFKDTNSFTRAFHLWTGETPGQFRTASAMF